ncbi:MAG: patatin-like phospholipase family protein [Bacteroidota bacterium]|nr:patatin-like phospholipase family protein [Bacteroidota bacterium]
MSTTYNLILSGGGARAYAQLGAIKALNENNFIFNAISGTSAGAVVGAFYCDGFSVEEIIELVSKNNSFLNFNYSLNKGFLSNEKLDKFLKKNLRSTEFEALKHPLFVSATNLNDGTQRIFNSGKIIDTLLAATSIPILYKPIWIDGIPYGDGAISSNLPVEPFYNSEFKSIGIHVNPIAKFDSDDNIGKQLERLFHLCVKETTFKNTNKVSLFIEPPELSQYGIFDFKKINEIIDIGYNYTLKLLQQLPVS